MKTKHPIPKFWFPKFLPVGTIATGMTKQWAFLTQRIQTQKSIPDPDPISIPDPAPLDLVNPDFEQAM